MQQKIPRNDAKINQFRIMLSNDELEKLNYCCEYHNLNKAAIVRQGIDEIYKKAKKKG